MERDAKNKIQTTVEPTYISSLSDDLIIFSRFTVHEMITRLYHMNVQIETLIYKKYQYVAPIQPQNTIGSTYHGILKWTRLHNIKRFIVYDVIISNETTLISNS